MGIETTITCLGYRKTNMKNEPVAWIRQSKYGKPIIVQNPCYQFSYQAECAKWDDIPLYTHPAKTEEFMAGDAICPSCGCKSLYKTARSEWCVTHKCLWQKDYDLTLKDEEIMDVCITGGIYDCINDPYIQKDGKYSLDIDLIKFARAILRKANEK